MQQTCTGTSPIFFLILSFHTFVVLQNNTIIAYPVFQGQYYAANSYQNHTKIVKFVLEYRLTYHSKLDSWSNFGWREL